MTQFFCNLGNTYLLKGYGKVTLSPKQIMPSYEKHLVVFVAYRGMKKGIDWKE
jgi:hypothetical protein